MNLPELCIRRPVMTTLLTAALCVFGVMAYRLLPVSDLPNVDFPTILVNANLPGATPETMASARFFGSTFAPGRRRSWPSVTTISPGLMPSAISVKSPELRVIFTGRSSTVWSAFTT